MKVKVWPSVGLTELQTSTVENLVEMIREFCNVGVTYDAVQVPTGFRSFFLEGAMHIRYTIKCHFRGNEFELKNLAPIHFFVDFRDDDVEVFVVVYRVAGEYRVVDWRRLYVLDKRDSLSLFNVFETVIKEVRNGDQKESN